jgi:hypothetical protein
MRVAVGRTRLLLLVALVLMHPLLTGLAGLSWGLFRLGKKRSRRRSVAREIPTQQALLARILLVGISGGLPIPAALALAHSYLEGPVATETGAVLRRSRREGATSALGQGGDLTRPLFSKLTMAAASGAPVGEAVSSYLAELRAEQRTQALERIRRLPVTLMIPLGLLILPGFVLLFVGPIVYRALSDLSLALP